MNRAAPNWLKRSVLPLLAVLLVVLYRFMEPSELVDLYFTRGISKFLLRGLSGVSGLVPFSAAEFMAIFLVGMLAMQVIKFLVALVTGDLRSQSFFKMINSVAILVIAFLLIWGFNYRAMGVQSAFGLEPIQGDQIQLEALSTALALEAGLERSKILAEDTLFTFTGDFHEASTRAYEEMGKTYPAFREPTGRAKPLMSSQFFSRMGISGIFFPYTGEANYNAHQPMLLLPSVVLHELAHLKGIAREEEANFIAYVASRYSPDPAVRYSGSMLALINTQNRLYGMDQDAHGRVRSLYSAGMALDIQEHNRYWSEFKGPVRETATQVNDSYLKANGQIQGVESYEDMVSYLLAYHLRKP